MKGRGKAGDPHLAAPADCKPNRGVQEAIERWLFRVPCSWGWSCDSFVTESAIGEGLEDVDVKRYLSQLQIPGVKREP